MWPPPSFPTSGGSSQGQGTEQGPDGPKRECTASGTHSTEMIKVCAGAGVGVSSEFGKMELINANTK